MTTLLYLRSKTTDRRFGILLPRPAPLHRRSATDTDRGADYTAADRIADVNPTYPRARLVRPRAG